MIKKPDLKTHRGNRIYTPVPRAPRISRLWIWDELSKEYRAPEQGSAFVARRYEQGEDRKRKRTSGFFASLDEAREWQAGVSTAINRDGVLSHSVSVEEPKEDVGPVFGEIVERWRKKKFSVLADGTRTAYGKLLRLHLQSLWNTPIREITPMRIDQWIEELKDPNGLPMQNRRRLTFHHELTVLSGVLRFYDEYSNDRLFVFPVKKRHWSDANTGRKAPEKAKDFTEIEFRRFYWELRKTLYGEVLSDLATVQYYQALRIGEAAAIHHEDVFLDRKEMNRSRLSIRRSVYWPRVKGRKTYVQLGFKNSAKFDGGVKELPIFPGSFISLEKCVRRDEKGLLFMIDGAPIEYRTIQHYYNLAFRRAGLPYRSTHVLRHGWTREVFNKTRIRR